MNFAQLRHHQDNTVPEIWSPSPNQVAEEQGERMSGTGLTNQELGFSSTADGLFTDQVTTAPHTSLYTPDDALIVRNIYIYIDSLSIFCET